MVLMALMVLMVFDGAVTPPRFRVSAFSILQRRPFQNEMRCMHTALRSATLAHHLHVCHADLATRGYAHPRGPRAEMELNQLVGVWAAIVHFGYVDLSAGTVQINHPVAEGL